jgi:hypothetical protein
MKKRILIITLLLFIPIILVDESITIAQGEDKVLICSGKNSKKYHSKRCSGLNRCGGDIITSTMSAAIKDGYTPCKICYR